MKIGYASIDITPPVGVELCGYGYFPGRRAEGVTDPLYARAVSIQQGEKTLLLINCDLIGLTQKITDGVKEQLSRRLNLDRKSIMILCTHTHTGPATGTLIACGEMDDSYMASLPGLLIQAGCEAGKHPREVKEIKYLKIPIEPIGFNRVFKGGPVDNNIRGLVFNFVEGDPLAIVNYACHPVTLGPQKHVSADYPGRVIKNLSDHGYDGLFLNGFCGDIDPVSNLEKWGSGTEDTIDAYGKRIVNAFLQQVSDETTVNDTMTADTVINDISINNLEIGAYEIKIDLKLQPYDDAKIDEEYNLFKKGTNEELAKIWAETMRKYLNTTENPYIESVIVQIFKIDKILFVGFPGEAFTELGTIIKNSLSDYHVITLGNCNSTMRYIPTEEDIINRRYAGYSSCFIYSRLPLVPGEGERLAQMTVSFMELV